MLNFFSPPAPIFFKGIPRCLAPHDSSAFTAERFILLQISLVVWQKNWKWTDYVYFQNRAYQSVIRPLWCSLLYLQLMIRVISAPPPSPDVLFSIKARLYLQYCVCVCVCSICQMIWMTLSNGYTTLGHKEMISLHNLSQSKRPHTLAYIFFLLFLHYLPRTKQHINKLTN